jgi:hypothetical protein
MNKDIILVDSSNLEKRIGIFAISTKEENKGEIISIITGFSVVDEAITFISKGYASASLKDRDINNLFNISLDFKIGIVNPFKLYNNKVVKSMGTSDNPSKRGRIVWIYKVVDVEHKELKDVIIK